MGSRQTEKSEATRNKILEQAKRLFCEKGFDKTTVKEIVTAAGVAQGTFYLYFEAKEEVLYKIIEQTFDSFNSYIAIMNDNDPIIDYIGNTIDIMVKYMEENPQIIRLLHNSNVLEIINSNNKFLKDEFLVPHIKKWIASAIDNGIISPKPPDLYARIVFQISHELLESAFLYGYPDKIEVIKQELKQIIKKILA